MWDFLGLGHIGNMLVFVPCLAYIHKIILNSHLDDLASYLDFILEIFERSTWRQRCQRKRNFWGVTAICRWFITCLLLYDVFYFDDVILNNGIIFHVMNKVVSVMYHLRFQSSFCNYNDVTCLNLLILSLICWEGKMGLLENDLSYVFVEKKYIYSRNPKL